MSVPHAPTRTSRRQTPDAATGARSLRLHGLDCQPLCCSDECG